MKTFQHTLWALVAIFAADLAVCSANDSWNQWRGSTRDSQLESADWPESLSGKLELLWEKKHQPSYSGPVIHNGRIFTTETVDEQLERVTAYDLESGEKLWQTEWPGAMKVPFFAAANGSWIRSTPICNDNQLIVLGMRDVMVSLDPATGEQQWKVDFIESMGSKLPSFGSVCSPIIDDGAIYVQNGTAVLKLNANSGELIWKTLEDTSGMMSSGAFSSPVIATLQGVRQLVVQTRLKLCGVDLASGEVLWEKPIEAFRGMNILTPLVIGDTIFTSAHSGRSQLLAINKTNDGEWSVSEVWDHKSQAYMSSPVLLGDSILMHMKNQRVVSLKTDGTEQWISRPYGKYWSMVAAGERVLALENTGNLMLLQKNPSELQIVDQVKVAEDSWAHLAVQKDLVAVRDLNALKVYRWKK